MNPGPHTLQGTNTYLVGAGCDVKVLVDTGEDSTAEEWLANLISLIRATKTKRLSHVFLTHGHHDHQGGVVKLLKALKKEGMSTAPVVYKRLMPNGGDYPPVGGYKCLHIQDGQEFTIQGGKDMHGNEAPSTTLKAYYTPGHTDDSICFLIKEDMALFSGDTVLGCGSAVFDNLTDLMSSLEKMRRLMLCAETNDAGSLPLALHTIYPGHGPVCTKDGLRKIDDYLENRRQREAAIVRALQESGAQPLSGMQLVDIVYRDVKLSLVLRLSAAITLHHHLEKLKSEGLVAERWPDLWLMINSQKQE